MVKAAGGWAYVNDYIEVTNQLSMTLSYSKKGCPFDNAPMESFHASLKSAKFIAGIAMILMKQIENFSIIYKVFITEIVFILL